MLEAKVTTVRTVKTHAAIELSGAQVLDAIAEYVEKHSDLTNVTASDVSVNCGRDYLRGAEVRVVREVREDA